MFLCIMCGMNPSEAIAELIARGYTERRIGDKIGVNQSTINRIRRGETHPAWSIGNDLIDLAKSAATQQAH